MENLKQKLYEHAIPVSLGLGALVFVASFNYSKSAYWTTWPAIGLAAVLFIVFTWGAYMVLNNIEDAYTLEASFEKQKLFEQLHLMESFINSITDDDVREMLLEIATNVRELVERTEESQPHNVLSVASTLLNWVKMVAESLEQYIDIQQNPAFHRKPKERLQKGRKAFESFKTFLLNSIMTLEDGDNLVFDVAVNMLDATRFDLIS